MGATNRAQVNVLLQNLIGSPGGITGACLISATAATAVAVRVDHGCVLREYSATLAEVTDQE
jgi:hypothetical protein